jgi:hypothetical protein
MKEVELKDGKGSDPEMIYSGRNRLVSALAKPL